MKLFFKIISIIFLIFGLILIVFSILAFYKDRGDVAEHVDMNWAPFFIIIVGFISLIISFIFYFLKKIY